MGLANGVHHLAICTGNIKAQIEFFTDVLGAELTALYWMHGVENTFHGFLRFNDSCSVAFVQNEKIAATAPVLGVSHAANPGSPSAPGTMQHVAFNVDSEADLLALRDRIRDRGINVYGAVDHGFCKSIYFAGPEGLNLEISTSDSAIDARAWIDPEVVALAGIDAAELERYKSPPSYSNRTGAAVANPPIDETKPHMVFPKAAYEKLMGAPDEVIAAQRSHPTPPVSVKESEA
ncbi:MAG: VOC family protein [Gammaproteobacteria bacterium]|nr:VOC family protein [Gammaproteobacteria bacterium]